MRDVPLLSVAQLRVRLQLLQHVYVIPVAADRHSRLLLSHTGDGARQDTRDGATD